MPRIKLQPHPFYEYRHTLTVRVTDLNYGNHLGNHSLAAFIHEARARVLGELNCTEFDLGDGKTGLVIADIAINFLGEGFIFDVIQIESHIVELSKKSFRIAHRLTCGERLIALAETGLVALDYKTRRVTALPLSFTTQVANKATIGT